MNCTERTHPIEITLLLALATVEAVVTLVSALVALVLAAKSRKPSASRTKPPAPAPFAHPLFSLSHDLSALTCRELRELTGTRARLPKERLVGMVVAVGV